MEYQDIIYEVKDKIAYITMNRPKSLNSMGLRMKGELADAIGTLEQDDAIWGVVITGTGRSFSAGADISEFPDAVEDARRIADFTQKLFARIENLSKPVIAAVNGFALGGGFELALSCDLCVASSKAKFGFSEVRIGAIPCYGGTQRLVRAVGKAKAKELIFTGRMVGAEEAERLGFVNIIAEDDDVIAKAKDLMAQILKNAPRAVAYAKICINRGAEMSLDYAVQLEQDLAAMLVPTHDFQEGSSAFLEKRAPEFTNC